MRRWTWLGWMGCLQACGPEAATGASDATSSSSSDETTSSSASVTSAEASSASPSSADTSSEGVDESSPSTGAEASTPETCTPGTFVGLYSVSFESSTFDSCDTGESWWFQAGGNELCRPEMWVTVEGELCGPGAYGHLGSAEYELRGEVIEGPCEAACGDTPVPAACSTFLDMCPFFECDPSSGDCPENERCTPVSGSGSPPWSGATCVPIDQPAHPIGSACTSEGGWSDDCVAQAHCVVIEPEMSSGRCAPLCSADDPCGLGSCWPCDFADDAIDLGVCSVDEVAC